MIMIDEKNTKQSISYNRPRRATINISRISRDDDDELLELMHQMIKNEREHRHSLKKPFLQSLHRKHHNNSDC